jgi:phospholipid/cholesterol/gamma-HCH transport system permease protein
VSQLDTFGAWLLEGLLRARREGGREAAFASVPDWCRGLLDDMAQVNRRPLPAPRRQNSLLAGLDRLGRTIAESRVETVYFFGMLGMLGSALIRVILRPWTFRLTSAVHQLDRVGWQAIGIILLITFLIGSIIAQQGFFHFRQFGADDYVVDLVAILVVREIGVLIVAIMVAGRSGSSYTAELGSMKMREELDALRTMGLDPIDVLMLPRVLALVCALPILTFLGNLSALFGGGMAAWLYGGMSPEIYLERLQQAVTIDHLKVGMIKAPFMALVIGVVACSQGLRVRGSAESLGLRTTSSVVMSIFLVIVLDGIFAIFFASIGI